MLWGWRRWRRRVLLRVLLWSGTRARASSTCPAISPIPLFLRLAPCPPCHTHAHHQQQDAHAPTRHDGRHPLLQHRHDQRVHPNRQQRTRHPRQKAIPLRPQAGQVQKPRAGRVRRDDEDVVVAVGHCARRTRVLAMGRRGRRRRVLGGHGETVRPSAPGAIGRLCAAPVVGGIDAKQSALAAWQRHMR